ncbi:MAG: DEAD/DEAH box helicase [Candidatus Thorarchaeota archaeon]
MDELRSTLRKSKQNKIKFQLYELAKNAGVFDLEKGFLISAPTASGKSKIGRDIILHQLVKGNSGILSLYLVPYKAIAEEVYAQLVKEVKEYRKSGRIEKHVEIAIATSDYDRPFNLHEIDVLVATYERAIGLLNKDNGRWPEVVIADELHIIADEERGPRIESLISNLSISENIRLYALSAVLRNPERISKWLQIEPLVGGDDTRPTNLEIIPKVTDNKAKLVKRIVSTNVDKGNIIVFCATKPNTIKLAETLSSVIEQNLSVEEKKRACEFAKEIQQGFPYLIKLPRLIEKGVAYHNADLEVEVRNLIVKAFSEGYIKVISATPTLAAGVNVPARVVILRDIQRYVSRVHGRRIIPVSEALNMLGRAGRPYLNQDGIGYVIITKRIEKTEWCKSFVKRVTKKQPEPVESQIPRSESNIQLFILSSAARLGDIEESEILRDYNATLWAHDGTKILELPTRSDDILRENLLAEDRKLEVGFDEKSIKINDYSISAKGGSAPPYNKYTILISEDRVTCTCQGFKYTHKCKHIRELQLRILLNELSSSNVAKARNIVLASLGADHRKNNPAYWIKRSLEKLVNKGFLAESGGLYTLTEDGRRALLSYYLSLEHITLLKDRIKSGSAKCTDDIIKWAIADYSPNEKQGFPSKIKKPFRSYLKGEYYREVFKENEIKAFLDARETLDQIFRTYHALLGKENPQLARLIRDARRRVHYGCPDELIPLMCLDIEHLSNPKIAKRLLKSGCQTISDITERSCEELSKLLKSDIETASDLLESAKVIKKLIDDFAYDPEQHGSLNAAIAELSIRSGISVDNLRDYVLSDKL